MTDTIWICYSRPRPHWYALSWEEQQSKKAHWDEVAQSSRQQGGSHLGRYHIRGSHDFQTVDLWRFTAPEAAFDHWLRLNEAGFGNFFAFSNNIGIAEGGVP